MCKCASLPGSCFHFGMRSTGFSKRQQFSVKRHCSTSSYSRIRNTQKLQVNRNPDDDSIGLINRKLPGELVLRVFSFLDVVSLCRCAQVSKLWNVLALDGSNWQRVDLFEFQRDISETVIQNLSRRCGGFLKRLGLKGCQSVGDGALRTFSCECRNIEELILEGCKKISDSQGCEKIEHINVSWCGQLTQNGVRILSEECSHIQSFIAKGCTLIQDEGVQHLARNCRNLHTLNLHSCELLTDVAIKAVGENCSDLQFLCVSGCLHLTDASLQALGEGCPHLRTIEVAQCLQLTDAGFSKLAKGCHNLEKMDLEECVLITDATLTNLSTWCSNLRQLSLSHCEQISDDGIHRLSAGHNAEEYLEVLELDNCPSITDTALYHLKDCRSLKRIELYDCQLITRGGIRRLKNHLPNLRVHAYFAPVTPPPSVGGGRRRVCRCCTIV
ncbi:F-box/LRR-repeat protein 20-like [Dendronephthya gigantea]|uniref:F-box/LRR-repeat protein 20-like n=1 Tax=Dendronephthya gigantea TaxID=151771 RepID=UPI00106C15A7|nr:F-box/LRR-repeat protein 20-like [Dendronephthya gigantea]